ncbi:MAG: YihY/virulence factor BrkB family protein, partial [Myxococcales bacterium]|nr:YihY/virulence factor BrkB family protein [Myxococcales bacterium]
MAAGLGFYGLFALFPFCVAVMSIYGLVADPRDVAVVGHGVARVLPAQAAAFVSRELASVVRASPDHLSLSAVISVGAAFWSATLGMDAVVRAVDRAHAGTIRKSFLARKRVALLFTAVAAACAMVLVPTTLALPTLAAVFELNAPMDLLRWPLFAAGTLVSVCALYRYAPERRPVPRWRDVLPSAATATLLLVLGTAAYGLYVEYAIGLRTMYGAIEGIVVLLMWIYVSAYLTVFGAELNAEFERRRRAPAVGARV